MGVNDLGGGALVAYKTLCTIYIDTDVIGEIRKSCQTGTPLGNEYFKGKIAQKLKCKIGQARRGRPSKGICPLGSDSMFW